LVPLRQSKKYALHLAGAGLLTRVWGFAQRVLGAYDLSLDYKNSKWICCFRVSEPSASSQDAGLVNF